MPFLPARLLLLLAILPLAGAPARAEEPARPRIGLVLGGGGARGAAHIGVLEVLERLRVPVDCVAGTSMGALVAGAWAAGLSPAQMRSELAAVDWNDMFQDNPDYTDLDVRNKRLLQRFLPGSETGLKGLEAVGPPGVVSGQKIKLFFNHLVRADTGEPLIERLPLPLSIVATDIGTGERVVYRDGSLTLAMRASMSVPGLMAPLDYRSRKLVDGGLVDNLPVREVRERCGAQVVIAVNVGSAPLAPEQVNGLLSITAQVIALLTEQNVSATLATLGAGDILIKPDLGAIGAADFERHAEAAERGRAAAEAQAAALARLALAPEPYAAWRRQVAVGERAPPRIDEIRIAGLQRADPAVVSRHLEQRLGAPLDTQALTRDLLRAYGDGHFERVDYSILDEHDRRVLRVLPVEKPWGPDYLRLGLRLESTLSQGSTYRLRAGYQKTWLNALGGELLVSGEIGSSTGLAADFHQPLDAAQRTFVEAQAEYRRERLDYFFLDQRVAEYRSGRSRLEVAAGLTLPQLGQLRLGWRETRINNRLDTGVDIFALMPERSIGGWLLSLDADRLDRLYAPRRGWALQASWFESPRRDYSRASFEVRGAMPWQNYVVGSRVAWVGAARGELPLSDAGRLGGFLNLTGFANGQLIGDDVAYAHVRAERIIGRLPLGLRGDMRLGVALETGRVGLPYARQRRDGWLQSLAVYIGGETPLGPVFLGLGQGSGKSTNAYLFIGTP
ncbi:Patatin [Rubrivivax sp. A210]|uniref:patatin-like phospholipase family protein n=1 Tax=Rubrivivax sp. A210 TaxID=2772301 RepID=UPI00191A7146|nr:patatin-like phospholipase family protein [Rubrivivax sp. A210]CAD5372525.1 Patatin [Rubrivivax sp. A210]